MISTRTLAIALTMALSSAAWAADRVAMDMPMTSMPGGAAGQAQPGAPAPSMGQGGSSMPMGMGMMPMQGGAGQQPGSPNMSMGSSPGASNPGGAMPMGMGMMQMQGAGSGQGGMSMPGGTSAGGMMMPMCGMPMMQGMMRGMSGSTMPAAASMTGSADYLEGRLAFLKAELKLTNSQLPLWEAFAAAVRGGQKDAMPGAAAGASITQRLDADEHQQAARLQATRQLKSTVTPLYAALDDNQKRLFDQLSQNQLGLL